MQDLVMGRFRVLERIGSGGMGTVYRAYDERLQRQVALKRVDALDPERVLREAQAAGRLNHPAIVTLYELGEHGGSAVLVSELVPGQTLAERRRAGLLCDRDVAEIVSDLCDALAHAHARGVVHRDIKPDNVIVCADRRAGRRAKLMDFGIASIAGAPTLTRTGEVVGTLAYMSPEQADGDLPGPATDVYSLALTAYECWAGANPVAAPTPAQTVRRIEGGVSPLSDARPDLPPRLTDAIDACLDPDPALRPRPRELRERLGPHALELDSETPLLAPNPASAPDLRAGSAPGRILVLAAFGLLLAALAGPAGAPGAALVLGALCVPSLIAGATTGTLAPVAAPVLNLLGIGAAGAALGAAGTTALARAALGIGAWAWLLCGSLTLGIGPSLGIGSPAPDGWADSSSVAADRVLGSLVSLESLLGAVVFAVAAVALGWVLAARHLPLALLGGMVWAAGVDAALTGVGNGALGAGPGGVLIAAAGAIGLEFGVLRGLPGSAAGVPSAASSHAPLAERLA